MRRLAAAIGVAALLCVPAVPAQADSAGHGGKPGHMMLMPTVKGRVVARHGVTIRSGPSTRFRKLGQLRNGRIVRIMCKVRGQRVRNNPLWYRLEGQKREWVSAAYVKNLDMRPRWCRVMPVAPGHDKLVRPGHNPSKIMPGQRPTQTVPGHRPTNVMPGNVATPSAPAETPTISVTPTLASQAPSVTHRARLHHD